MKKQLSLIAIFLFIVSAINSQTLIFPYGSTWKYLDNGSNQGTSWTGTSFNDASWSSGLAELGYGDTDQTTVVNNANGSGNIITTYFRKTISITNPSQYTSFTADCKVDDGVVVYVNGTEAGRYNMPSGTITNITVASTSIENFQTNFTINSSLFIAGNNTIAVEIHQVSTSSSDISFDLQLTGNSTSTIGGIKNIRWGSQGDPLNGLTITWTNTGLADSIQWGYTSTFEKGKYLGVKRNSNSSGKYFFNYIFPTVQANSTIYYKIFDDNANAWSSEYTYNTAPPVNTNNFCFLAIGDSRTNMVPWGQIANLANSKNADFAIFNGDIVEDGGVSGDWDKWFQYGDNYLKNNLIYHSMGNHDVQSGASFYTNTFDLPQTNNSELYYSFKYGDVLFISLNSENSNDAAQYNWLINTLQANASALWKVVYFHRPFYTIGPHSGEMNGHFNTWWKAFDDYGVDIVTNGHDHMYERTKPINRNVSTSNPVAKYGSGPNEGRCQIVCGGAGAPLTSANPSSVNFIQAYQSKYHFCEFCVNGGTITCNVYDNTNAIIDSFTLSKTTTGISTNNQNFNKLEIYPNPAKNKFTIKSNSPINSEGVINVVDLNGRKLREEKVIKYQENFEYEINNLNLAAGIYFVELIVDGHKDVGMLMINE